MSSKGSVPKRSSAGETPVVDSMWRRTVVSEESQGAVVTRSCVGVKMAVEGLLPDRRDNCQLAFS